MRSSPKIRSGGISQSTIQGKEQGEAESILTSKKTWLAAGLVAGLFFIGRKARAMEDIQLSPHFKLSEFLRSRAVPEVKNYKPNAAELANLKILVDKVLEPMRVKFGPVFISGGMRPDSVRNAKGQNFTQALEAAGYKPAPEGDHTTFNGVDFQLPKKSVADYLKVYQWLKGNPYVRQVILYLRTDAPSDTTYPDHIHVSSVAPGRPRFQVPEKFAYLTLDGRKVPEIYS